MSKHNEFPHQMPQNQEEAPASLPKNYEIIKQRITDFLHSPDHYRKSDLAEIEDDVRKLSDPNFMEITEEAILYSLKNCRYFNERRNIIDGIAHLKERFDYLDECIRTPSIQESARRVFFEGIRRKSPLNQMLLFKNTFLLPDDLLTAPEMQDAVQERVAHHISTFDSAHFEYITQDQEALKISDEIIAQGVKDGLIKRFGSNSRSMSLDDVDQFRKAGTLTEESVREVKLGFMLKELQEGAILSAIEFKKDIQLTKEETVSPEIQESAKKALYQAFDFRIHTNTIQELVEEFAIPKELVKQAAEYAVRTIVESPGNDLDSNASDILPNILEIKTAFDIPDDLNISANYPTGMKLSDWESVAKVPSVGNYLIRELHNLSNFSYCDHVRPIIDAQGEAAFLYLRALKKAAVTKEYDSEDMLYVTYIAKKFGTKARDILESILLQLPHPATEKERIDAYLSDVNLVDFNIYSEYRDATDPLHLEVIKMRVNGLAHAIYHGEVSEVTSNDPLYHAAVFKMFPPAVGLTRDQYEQLNRTRPDRRDDVPESLDTLQYQESEIATGRYVLTEDTTLNLEKWTRLSEIVKTVNHEHETNIPIEVDRAAIGERLVQIFREGTAKKSEQESYIWETLYRYHLAKGGGPLPVSFSIDPQGLMQYKEFIGDHMKNDLVKECLSAWKEKNPAEYDALRQEVTNRAAQNKDRNWATLQSMMRGIKKQRDEQRKIKAIEKLDEFLTPFGLTYEQIKDEDLESLHSEISSVQIPYEGSATEENYRSEEYYNSEEFVNAYDQFVTRHDPDELTFRKVSSDLVSDTNKAMRKELDKFGFNESGNAEKVKLEFCVSKKKEHGVAGYNMGVCVTPDEQLWNDRQFMNCIIWDPAHKEAKGGMHFLNREGNLCLPGINPSMAILGQTRIEDLYDKMITYAIQVRDRLGLQHVLIPVDAVIHSNRSQIQEVIQKKKYPIYNLRDRASFSYSPYAYSFQECFLVSPMGPRTSMDDHGIDDYDKKIAVLRAAGRLKR